MALLKAESVPPEILHRWGGAQGGCICGFEGNFEAHVADLTGLPLREVKRGTRTLAQIEKRKARNERRRANRPKKKPRQMPPVPKPVKRVKPKPAPRDKTQPPYPPSKYEWYIASPAWAQRRVAWFKKFGRYCRACGADDVSIHLHHKTYVRLGCEQDQDLVGLCKPCHDGAHALHRQRGKKRNDLAAATDAYIKQSRAQ